MNITRLFEFLVILGCAALAGPSAAQKTADTRMQPKEQQKLQQKKDHRMDIGTHHTATINGVRLHYVEAGSGTTLLFLHGFPEFWYAWKDQIQFFGKRYHVVAPDMRGYNLSEKPEKVESYAVPVLVEDVRALLDRISPGKKAVLIGHDWGGAIAWAFAMLHPEYLEKLIIINAPHPGIFLRELQSNPDQQKASGYMNLFRTSQAEGLLAGGNYAALTTVVFNGTTKPDAFSAEDRKAYLEAWAQPGALTGGLNYYRAADLGPPQPDTTAKPEIASGLAKFAGTPVKVPTLVLWGEKDTALLAGNLNGLDKLVPNLKVQRIPTGSHWVVHEEPELVNQAISNFIQSRS